MQFFSRNFIKCLRNIVPLKLDAFIHTFLNRELRNNINLSMRDQLFLTYSFVPVYMVHESPVYDKVARIFQFTESFKFDLILLGTYNGDIPYFIKVHVI
jgi:hypothetical protein